MDNNSRKKLFEQADLSKRKRFKFDASKAQKARVLTDDDLSDLKEPDLIEGYKNALNNYSHIQTLADEVYESMGMSRNQCSIYLSNPNNFSDEEWQMIQNESAKLDDLGDKISSAVKSMSVHSIKNKIRKRAVTRKKKHMGSRRDWLSM